MCDHHIIETRLPFLLQKDGDPAMKDTVVLLLQDMLEVVTRDMMVNEIRLVNFIAISPLGNYVRSLMG